MYAVFFMLQDDCVSKREACFKTLMNSVSAAVAVQPRSAHDGGGGVSGSSPVERC